MHRKGFPESYDRARLVRFLADVKAGAEAVDAPVYSHQRYDIVPGASQTVRQPDIVIVEGLNVLQAPPERAETQVFASDFFDFTIYVDADEADIERWYVERFLRLRDTVFQDPQSYFHRYAALDEAEARATAAGIWDDDQRREPAREHRADAAARAPDPAQGREPRGRAGAAAATVGRRSGRRYERSGYDVERLAVPGHAFGLHLEALRVDVPVAVDEHRGAERDHAALRPARVVGRRRRQREVPHLLADLDAHRGMGAVEAHVGLDGALELELRRLIAGPAVVRGQRPSQHAPGSLRRSSVRPWCAWSSPSGYRTPRRRPVTACPARCYHQTKGAEGAV